MKKIVFAIFTCLLFMGKAWAQQDPHYSLYVFNPLPYNAATTADKGVTTINAQYRNQWLKLDGAPKTVHLNAQMPFAGGSSGVGVALTSDKIGMTDNNSLQLSYAYRLKMTEKTHLRLGLQGSFDQFAIHWEKADPLETGDQSILTDVKRNGSLNFGLGAQLSSDRYFVGVGMPKLLPTALYSDPYVKANGSSIVRTLYAMAGVSLPVGDKVKILPTAMVVYNKHVPFEAEVALQAVFMNKFGIGANYRLDDSIDALFMYNINQHLKAGFAWDFTLSKLKQTNNGGFEIMLGYRFGNDAPDCGRFDDVRFF